MKPTVAHSCGNYWYIYLEKGRYIWLLPDGTITANYIDAKNKNWKTEQEAQQFLDNWMPRKKKLGFYEVEIAAKGCEQEALDCSIEHWKQNVLDVEHANLGSPYCAVCVKAGVERDEAIGSWRNGRACRWCIVNDYKILNSTNCCKEYAAFCGNRTEENAIAMLNKLVLIRNKKYGNPYKQYNVGIDLAKEKKMTKEMTVAQVAKELGYDVKIVKESVKPKPYQFKAGDVVENSFRDKRIIVRLDGKLTAIGMNGTERSRSQEEFEIAGYKKIGELKDFIN